MLINGFPAGPWGTNCWIIATSAGQECIVVDPGHGSGPVIREVVEEHRLRPAAVVLTHGHIDHVWSVTPVARASGAPAYIHTADVHRLRDPIGTSFSNGREALLAMTEGELELTEPDDVRELVDGQGLEVAGIALMVHHAPGHTEGSAVFTFDDGGNPTLLSGDVLFAGSIGRTDLPGGDHAAMLTTLRTVILPMPDPVRVLPGHGPDTTIGAERATNPFLQGL